MKLLRMPGIANQVLRFLDYEMFLQLEEAHEEEVMEIMKSLKKNLRETEGICLFSADLQEGYYYWFNRLLGIQEGLRIILSPIATFVILGYFSMLFPMARINEFIQFCDTNPGLDPLEAKLLSQYLSKTIHGAKVLY